MFTPGHDGVRAQFSGIPLTYLRLMGAKGWAATLPVSYLPSESSSIPVWEVFPHHLTAENTVVGEKLLTQMRV